MLLPTMERVIRWVLPGILLIVVSCGDFQDPASGLAPHSAAVSNPQEADTTSLLLSPVPHESGDVGTVLQSTTDVNGPGGPPSAFQHSWPASASSPTQMEQASPAFSTGESRVSPVTLAWNPSPSRNATGYYVHVLSLPSRFMFTADAGSSTSLTLTVPTGETYYFSVTVYNTAGESDRSAYLKHMLP